MGANDSGEMLEAARAECVRLEHVIYDGIHTIEKTARGWTTTEIAVHTALSNGLTGRKA